MSNVHFSNRKLVLAYAPDFIVQSAFDVALADGDINSRQPQNTPAFHGIIPFRETFRECTGEYVRIEKITGKIARFTIAFDATAKFLAGWFAYLQGTTGAPAGSPANESQTLNLHGATAGFITLGLDFEGLSGTSVQIATTVALTAATVRAALEAIRPIKPGNVAVTGAAGGPFTISFSPGKLAHANLPLLTLVDSSTGGTGVTIAAAVDGANNVQEITRNNSETPVKFSLIEGFDDNSGVFKKYKNLVVDSWTAAVTRRGKVILTIVAFGSAFPDAVTGYTVPDCANVDPLVAGDCRLKIGSAYVTADLLNFNYTESNNIDVSEQALRFDDIDIDELERGDRTALFTAQILGSPTATLYAFAEDENTAFDTMEIDFGQPGERLAIKAPHTQFRLEDGLIAFVGNKNKSAFSVQGRPSPDGSGIVTRGTYTGDFATQFLLT